MSVTRVSETRIDNDSREEVMNNVKVDDVMEAILQDNSWVSVYSSERTPDVCPAFLGVFGQ